MNEAGPGKGPTRKPPPLMSSWPELLPAPPPRVLGSMLIPELSKLNSLEPTSQLGPSGSSSDQPGPFQKWTQILKTGQ